MTGLIEQNKVDIKGETIKIVEYKGTKVLSSYDIAGLHNKELKRVNEQFERNKDRLKEGVDYFLIDKEEFSESLSATQNFIPNNVKDIKLFTERGYLKLVKSFTDDLSWEIQDLLVDSYFTLAQLSPKAKYQLGIINASTEVDRMVALNEYEVGYVRPLEMKVEEQAAALEETKPKLRYHDIVLSCPDLLTITQISQDYPISNQRLNKILADKGVQYRDKNGMWCIYAKYGMNQYAQTHTHTYKDKKGNYHSKLYLKWTQKGRLFIYELLKEEGILPNCEM